MRFDTRVLSLLLVGGFMQTAIGEESQQVVVWTITTSNVGKTLEKTSALHKTKHNEILELQSKLNNEDSDLFIDLPELRRVYYRYTPRGYRYRQTFYIRQRDTGRFDEFFEALAPLDSGDTRVNFAYRTARWEPPVKSNPTIATWEVIVIGNGKTLVESKRNFDGHATGLRKLLADHETTEAKQGNPYMVTVPENLSTDEKPQGFSYHQKFTFQQTNMDKFESSLKKFEQIDSVHLNVQFTLGTKNDK